MGKTFFTILMIGTSRIHEHWLSKESDKSKETEDSHTQKTIYKEVSKTKHIL